MYMYHITVLLRHCVMRGDRIRADEQEHDKLLNDDHSACASMTVCEMHIIVCVYSCVCVSPSRGSPLTGGTQRSSHLQSVIRMLISPWELT